MRAISINIAAIVAITFAHASPDVRATEYSFTNVADTTMGAPSGTFSSFQLIDMVYVEPPALSGTNVAFVAAYNSGTQTGVFRGSGGPITTIAKTGDLAPLNVFREFNQPAINGDMVAFQGGYDNVGHEPIRGIFMGNGGVPTAIAREGDRVPVSGFGGGLGGVRFPAFNGNAVGFWAAVDDSRAGIFSGAGGPLTTVVPPATIFSGPAFSDDTVAFAGLVNNVSGVLTRTGNTTTTIARSGDTVSGVRIDDTLLGEGVAISGDTVVFFARTHVGSAIFVGSGGPLALIANRGDPAPVGTFTGFRSLPGDLPSISGDTVTFSGEFANGLQSGIFTSTDGSLATVIKTGDPLFGSTISDVTMGRFGLDPDGSGNLAFWYSLADGRQGVALARVIPEPSTLAMIGLALLAVSGCVRRRSPCGATQRARRSGKRSTSMITWSASALLSASLLFSMSAPRAHAQMLDWVRQFGTAENDSSYGIAADGLGNVYITGETTGSLGGPNAGSYDAFLTKYDAAGTLQWTRQLGTSVRDYGSAVSADNLGNVYLAGTTFGSLTRPSAGSGDLFLSKYDAAGNPEWTTQFGSQEPNYSSDVSTDGLGNVYISGHTDHGLGRSSGFARKYDAAGNLQWTGGDEAISADGLGDLYTAGTESHFSGMFQGYISKLDADGKALWSRSLTESSSFSGGVSADSLGNVYFTYSVGFAHYSLSKYDAEGNLQWTELLANLGDDRGGGGGVSADGLGNVYITAINAGIPFVSMYDASGIRQWWRQLPAVAPNVSADALGNIYLSGSTDGSLGGPNAGKSDVFLARYIIPEPATWLLAAVATALIGLHRKHSHRMQCTQKAYHLKLPVALVFVFAVVFLREVTRAQTVYHWNSGPGNSGHYYMATDSASSWTDAGALATSRGGYLASVLSQEENNFLRDTFSNPASSDATTAYWIGLTDAATEGTFVWTSGEPLGYTNWGAGEPTNSTGGAIGTPAGEDYTAINWQRAVGLGTIAGQWNDTPNNGTTDGGTAIMPYRSIIEFNSTPLPEPPNLVLNGSFESGDFTGTYFGNTYLEAGSTAIAGWTVVQSDIIWGDNDASDSIVYNVSASEGERLLDLTGFDNLPFGGVEQAIPTEPGRRYRLEFDLGTNPARFGNTQTLIAQVGASQTTFSFTGTGDSSQYQRYGLDFVADSSSTLIRFTGATPSGLHIGLDNVVVRNIPEPASWLLMTLAGAGILCIARRRNPRTEN